MSDLPDDGTDHLELFKLRELPKLGPQNVKAERAVWMTRTSDIHGDFTKTNIDTYLTLIRRKVQEKCNSIQDLMQHIRMNKINNSNHVTPNEFRYTLIKFGVILPQPLVDNVFRIFDSDRSGTMDFDEFAMWIMNSEFAPVVEDVHANKRPATSPTERLRLRVKADIEKNPKMWKIMKKKVSFMELVSDCNRVGSNISEKDIRTLFLLFDTGNSGSVPSERVKSWAVTGDVPHTPSTAEENERIMRTTSRPSIKSAIFKICGRSTNLLSDCFAHFPVGEEVTIDYEEFRRCILSRGLGNPKDTKNLFFACGGEPGGRGTIVVDHLLHHLPPKELILASSGTAPTFKMGERAMVPISRADRALREALRKRHKFIYNLFKRADAQQTGYLPVHVVHEILNQHVLPLAHADFRHIIKNVMSDDTQQLNYNHIMTMYNPMKAPHILDGAKGAAALAGESVTQTMRDALADIEGALEEERSETTMVSPSVPASKTPPADARAESRRNWQMVLRECQKVDTKKSGVVYREVFLDAINKTGLKKTFGDASSLSEMADQFMVRDGQIDYLACFRQYLNGMVVKLPSATSPSRFQRKEENKARETDGNHPWDYGYVKERTAAQPYWLNSTLPKEDASQRGAEDSNGEAPSPGMKPSHSALALGTVRHSDKVPMNTGGEAVSDAGRVAMLRGIDKTVVGTCNKCNRALLPIWRELRGEFKRCQDPKARGTIAVPVFQRVLESFGVRLAGAELTGLAKAFGPKGRKAAGNAIKFDDFMRICLVSSPAACRAAGM